MLTENSVGCGVDRLLFGMSSNAEAAELGDVFSILHQGQHFYYDFAKKMQN